MIDDQKKQELREKHGTVFEFEKAGYTVVLRKPVPLAYKQWVNGKDNDQHGAWEKLARACIVEPSDPMAVSAMFDDVPGLVVEIGAECLALAHKSEKSEAKKL